MIPYKYIIAFLATKQQKDWAKPNSNWVLVNSGGKWTPEAKQYLKNLPGSGQDVLFTPNGYLNLIFPDTIKVTSNGNYWIGTVGYIIYYDPYKELSIVFPPSTPPDKIQSVLEFANKYDYPLQSGVEKIT